MTLIREMGPEAEPVPQIKHSFLLIIIITGIFMNLVRDQESVAVKNRFRNIFYILLIPYVIVRSTAIKIKASLLNT